MAAIALGRFEFFLMPISVVWMTNLYNFMDGMDGFAGGMTTIGFAFIAYVAFRSANDFVFVGSLLLVAAAGGFLINNFRPARIFMGAGMGSWRMTLVCGLGS